MAQERIQINGEDIWQPDSGELEWDFETTSTTNSTRTRDGVMHERMMFTVEALSYKATDVPVAEVSKILQMIVGKTSFSLHYYSLYYNAWRTDTFRVGKGSSAIKTLQASHEKCDSFEFNMSGVNPIA